MPDKLGKIRPHHSKERLKISKISKFLSDLLKAYKDTAPQIREILQTFVWWGHNLAPHPHHKNVCKFSHLTHFTDVCMVGGTILPPPHHTNVCKKFSTLRRYIFSKSRRVRYQFGKFTNFKALFSVVWTDFP